MHPVNDVDALLLLAVTLSAKRRPAELAEIMAAVELIRSPIPAELDLDRAFQRLSGHGLIATRDGGFVLTAEGQELMSGQSAKGDGSERIRRLKEALTASVGKEEHSAIAPGQKALCTAILAHRAAQKSPAKNLLVPKPQAAEARTGPGVRRRKPMPARKRRD